MLLVGQWHKLSDRELEIYVWDTLSARHFCGLAMEDSVLDPFLDVRGDRIKTDRRDARKLAEYFAAGLLTECFVPDQELIATRELVRSRSSLMKNLPRSKLQIIHFLHGRGHTYNQGNYWTNKVYDLDQSTQSGSAES